MIGGLIMVHGDDRGLRMPPRVAPIQVVIIPIGRGADGKAVHARCRALADELGSIARVRLDDRPEYTPGYKYNDWEMRGVPLRIEVGPRDLKAEQVVIARRDTGQKTTVALAELPSTVARLLDEVQQELFRQASEYRGRETYTISRCQEADAHGYRGFFRGGWCGSEACADSLKIETGMTIRCLPLEPESNQASCAMCGATSRQQVLLARAY